jgi:hypothetical protein
MLFFRPLSLLGAERWMMFFLPLRLLGDEFSFLEIWVGDE